VSNSDHISSSINPLTDFGRALALATEMRDSTFETNISRWPENYRANQAYSDLLRKEISQKAGVIIAGAGKQNNLDSYKPQIANWFRAGVHWTNFNPDIDITAVISTHIAPLEATLYSECVPDHLIHGVYSKVPPCLSRSCTVRWSDPFMNKSFAGKPTAQDLDALMEKMSTGAAPYLPSVRNTIFLSAMVSLWLGARHIVFTGVDPLTPDYFFTGNPDLTLRIVKCVAAVNPWLAEWDGRNERIGVIKRDTAHRVQVFIQNLLMQRSAVGGKKYLHEFDRGFILLRQLAEIRGVQLGYIGESKYMETTEIPRLA